MGVSYHSPHLPDVSGYGPVSLIAFSLATVASLPQNFSLSSVFFGHQRAAQAIQWPFRVWYGKCLGKQFDGRLRFGMADARPSKSSAILGWQAKCMRSTSWAIWGGLN